MTLSQVPRLLRTTRHLRWSQLAARASLTLKRKFSPPRELPLPAAARVDAAFTLPPCPAHTCDQGSTLVDSLAGGELRLLNQTLPFGDRHWDWRLGGVSQHRLWVVTLHYHQWLFELGRVAAEPGPQQQPALALWTAALDDWLQTCRCDAPGAGSLAWNSYAIATRLSWSIRNWQLFQSEQVNLDTALAARWRDSLFRQAEHLHGNIEWDLRANHLLRDAVGLAWAGRFFAGPRAERWLQTAQRIAVAQAAEQVLDDGGHFERSPFYHVEVMEDWLALATLLPGEEARQTMARTWRRAADYARWLRHPDGAVAHFNDGAVIDPGHSLAHGASIGQQVEPTLPRGGRHFANSGMAVWHGPQWSLFWDVGQVGADVQPGHAHADTLALECSFKGSRLFVDPGCYSYDLDARRTYDRSTAAHNTLSIDDTDSTEVWHIFRVGRRAQPRDVQIQVDAAGLRGAAAHDGYRHLPGRPAHRRRVELADPGELTVCDQVSGAGQHAVQCRWLVAEPWTVQGGDEGWRLKGPEGSVKLTFTSSQPLRFELGEAEYHPQYGLIRKLPCIGWRYEGELPLQVTMSVQEI